MHDDGHKLDGSPNIPTAARAAIYFDELQEYLRGWRRALEKARTQHRGKKVP
jgi:hypothetical protein